MTSVLGLSMPKFGISKKDLTSPKTIVFGTIAAGGLATGAVRTRIHGNPLLNLGVGAAVAAAAIAAATLGNANVYYPDTHGGHYDWHDDGWGGHYDYHDPHH